MSAAAITLPILIFIVLFILVFIRLTSLTSVNEIDLERRNLRGHIFTRGRRSKYAERWDVA